MKLTFRSLYVSIAALVFIVLMTACSSQKDTSKPASSSPSPVEWKQQPFHLPQGYRQVETSSYQIAIPEDWSYQPGDFSDSLVFRKADQELGQSEVIGWFDSSTWVHMRPNHSEQTGFDEAEGLLGISGEGVHLYSIQLTHTKPAAAGDPDWEYKESRWYVAVKAKERSYGFYFSTLDVDVAVMKSVVSSFRLKS